MTEFPYYLALTVSNICVLLACAALACYTRKRWKWSAAPVYFIGLALVVAITLTAVGRYDRAGYTFSPPDAAPVEVYPADPFPPAPPSLPTGKEGTL